MAGIHKVISLRIPESESRPLGTMALLVSGPLCGLDRSWRSAGCRLPSRVQTSSVLLQVGAGAPEVSGADEHVPEAGTRDWHSYPGLGKVCPPGKIRTAFVGDFLFIFSALRILTQ